MLAYVFWHWRNADSTRDAYEASLVRFHERFASVSPAGLLGSASVRARGAPWANSGGDAIEDWYLLDGSPALDVINEVAVTGDLKAPHDDIARKVAGACAGLYLLRARRDAARGTRVLTASHATWFSKPAGLAYDGLLESVHTHVPAESWALWGRYLGLGPTPEFLLLTDEPPKLPEGMGALTVRRELVWAGGSGG